MATFTVDVRLLREASVEVEVEAADEDEAMDKAYEMYEAGNLDILASGCWDYDFEIVDIWGDDE